MNATHWWKLASFAFAILIAPAVRSAEFYSEDLRIPMAAAGARGLEAFLMRPAAPGKYPLALIGHGTPRDVDDRADMSARSYRAITLEFARRGFAALVVLRRGYGTSQGSRADSYGSCNNPDYRGALAISVADLQAAIAAMKNRSDVATQGMIAIGHSAGGLATVGLVAQAPPGLVAAISFAGGRGSRSTGMVCGEKTLVELFRQLGTTSRIPMLWVYATNDGYFPPPLAHRFLEAFRAGGDQISFVDAPAFGDEGHYLFSTSSAVTWTPYVDSFLDAQGLLPSAVSTSGVSTAGLPVPPQLGDSGKQAFSQFMSRNRKGPVRVAPDGSFGWRSGMPSADDAAHDALAACASRSARCALYAVDDALSH